MSERIWFSFDLQWMYIQLYTDINRLKQTSKCFSLGRLQHNYNAYLLNAYIIHIFLILSVLVTQNECLWTLFVVINSSITIQR